MFKSISACTIEGAKHEVSVNYCVLGAGGGSYAYTAPKITGCSEANCPDRQPGGFNANSLTSTNSQPKPGNSQSK